MRKLKRQLLAGPYILWMTGFILLPIAMVLYYAFTTTGGSFTLLNVSSIAFSVQHTVFRGNQFHIFRADYHIHRSIAAEALVHAREFYVQDLHQAVVH